MSIQDQEPLFLNVTFEGEPPSQVEIGAKVANFKRLLAEEYGATPEVLSGTPTIEPSEQD